MDKLVETLEIYGMAIKPYEGKNLEESIKNIQKAKLRGKLYLEDFYNNEIKIDDKKNRRIVQLLVRTGKYEQVAEVLMKAIQLTMWEEVWEENGRQTRITVEFDYESRDQLEFLIELDFKKAPEKYIKDNQQDKLVGIFNPSQIEQRVVKEQVDLFYEFIKTQNLEEKEEEIGDALDQAFAKPGDTTELFIKRLKKINSC